MLVSPSESPAFRALGRSTWRCETFGVDAMWVANGDTYGIQRKELKDLVASVQDGRLTREVMQMAALDVAVLVVETGERGGAWPREMGGVITGTAGWGRGWTVSQMRGLLWSLQARGIWVTLVRDEAATMEYLGELERWSRKKEHSSLLARGQAKAGLFGKRGSREFGMWMLMSLPGVGPKMAGDIWDHFGGDVVRLSDKVGGVEGLTKVKGVGKVTAKKIVEILGGEGMT